MSTNGSFFVSAEDSWSQSVKRRYLCRTFVLESESAGGSKPDIAIAVERQRSVLIDLARRFQLTDREIEAVQHLADAPPQIPVQFCAVD